MSTDIVNHPAHYVDQSVVIEPIDFCDMLPFCLGNALKYVFRAGHKDGASELQDLKKAQWYLERYQRSPHALKIEEDDQEKFYSLASCLQFSKSEILRIAYQFSSSYFTFWGYLNDNAVIGLCNWRDKIPLAKFINSSYLTIPAVISGVCFF